MAHFDTEAEPPLDAVLLEPEVEVVLELADGSEFDPLAGGLVLLVVDPLLDWVSVVEDEGLTGVRVCTHGFTIVGVPEEATGEVELVAVEDELPLPAGVTELLVEDGSAAVPVAGMVPVAQAEAPLVPLRLPVDELSSGEELLSAEAPVVALTPTPPAVGL